MGMDLAALERNLKKGDKYRETLNETDKKVDGETATCVFNRVAQPQQSMFWNCRSEIGRVILKRGSAWENPPREV